MSNLFSLMKAFEKRNNISVYLSLCSDQSCSLYEFWSDEELCQQINLKEMELWLKETNYELDPTDGRCFSPVRIKS